MFLPKRVISQNISKIFLKSDFLQNQNFSKLKLNFAKTDLRNDSAAIRFELLQSGSQGRREFAEHVLSLYETGTLHQWLHEHYPDLEPDEGAIDQTEEGEET